MSRRGPASPGSPPPAEREPRRSGVVACLGLTNVGKSTLINRLLGQKLAIVSPKPQTTSRRLRGIVNAPGGQFVIVDTPGLHASDRVINRALLAEARRAIAGADAVLAVVDPTAAAEPGERALLLDLLREARLPAVLAVNKADLLPQKALGAILRGEREAGVWTEVIGVSALTGRNIRALVGALLALLPVGEPRHSEEILSDQPEREFFAEMIREQIFHALHQELPYSVAVVIDEVAESPEPHRYRIRATLYVERDSQKGIIIGAGGSGLRRIGERARIAIEELTGAPVHLGLWVKVRRNWTRDERSLREFGFDRGE
ncbi:MAG TPA: GTPase Era [Vicinamibacteria bacterium]